MESLKFKFPAPSKMKYFVPFVKFRETKEGAISRERIAKEHGRTERTGIAKMEMQNIKNSSEDADSLFLDVLFLECTACGEPNATKKCRKRHGGCADKRFCDGACDSLGHVKETPVEEKGNVEAPAAVTMKKTNKMRTDKKVKKAKKHQVKCSCCSNRKVIF